MANKEAVFTVKVNTGNSIQDIQNADKAVQQLGKDLKSTQTVAKDSSGTDAMSQRLSELDAKLEAGGLSMRELTKTMKEYQNIAINAGATSPVGAQALQSASALKDQIGDLKAQTTALSSDFVKLDTSLAGVEVGAQAFSGVQSAMALTGIENEALTASMVKLQAVQGLSNSISVIANKLNSDSILGIQIRTAWEKLKNSAFVQGTVATTAQTTATTAQTTATVASTVATAGATNGMKLFRLALIGTGIGAIVVALGLLIANFDTVAKVVQNPVKQFEKLGILGKIVAFTFMPLIGIFQGVSKALQYFGVIESDATKQMKANAQKRTDASVKEADARIKSIKRMQSQQDATATHEINLMKASGKETYNAELQKQRAHLATGRVMLEALKQKQSIFKAEMEILLASEDQDSERYKNLKKRLKDTNTAISETYKDNVATKNAIEVMIAEHNHEIQKEAQDRAKEAYDKAKANREKIAEEQKKADEKSAEDLKKNNEAILDEEERIAEELRRSRMTEMGRELDDIQTQYFEKKTQAEMLGAEGAELLAKLTAEEETKKAEVRKKYADKELQEQAKREQQRRDRQKFLNDILLSDEEKAIAELNQTIEDARSALTKRLNSADENEVITKEQYDSAILALEKKKEDKITEIQKAGIESRKAEAIKEREEGLKNITEFLANAQMVLDHVKTVDALMDEIDQARLNKIQGRRDEDLANLDEKMKAELNAEGLTADQRNSIEEKFAKQKYKIELDAYNAEEKIRKQQFMRDKAIKLGQVAIDTASAIVKAIAQFGPPPSPLGIAGIASAGVIGITQAMAIANQQYKAGGAPSAPNVSTGGGGSLSGASASSFTTSPTQTSTSGLIDQPGTNDLINKPTQVYVLESDISATQNKVQLQESKTSF
jgi:hypothetical protein